MYGDHWKWSLVYSNWSNHSVVDDCGNINLGPLLVNCGNHEKPHVKNHMIKRHSELHFTKRLEPRFLQIYTGYLHEVFWASSWRSFFPSLLFCAPISNFYLPNLVYILSKKSSWVLIEKNCALTQETRWCASNHWFIIPKTPTRSAILDILEPLSVRFFMTRS